MPRGPLPDDPDEWPRDPFALLGVSRSADQTTVRRAYTALIRLYKPEQAPTQFRLVRDAYESVIAQLKWRWQSSQTQAEEGDEDDDSDDSEDFDHRSDVDDGDSRSRSDSPNSAPRDTIEAEADAAWLQAKSGQLEVGYHRLVSLYQRAGTGHQIGLRLYWLLRAARQLDPARVPCDWLAAALSSAGLGGPASELYRRELRRNPAEALSDRCIGLFQHASSTARLVELLEWRWHAVARQARYDVIVEDLETFRQRIHGESEEQWLCVLMAAAGHLAWTAGDQAQLAFADCHEEIESLVHLHTTHGFQFERLDVLRGLASAWDVLNPGNAQTRIAKGLEKLPIDWGPLLRDWWNSSYDEIRPQLVKTAASIAVQPLVVLEVLTGLREYNPIVAGQLAMMFTEFTARQQMPEEASPDIQEISRSVQAWLMPRSGGSYKWLRGELLTFCIQTAIPPQTVAEIAEQRTAFRLKNQGSLSFEVETDTPLKAVFAICMTL